MLREGAYSSDDADGPSLTFQGGLLIPGIADDPGSPGFGASAALLLSQWWEVGTLRDLL